MDSQLRCEKCGHSFTRRFNLQRHVRICKQQIILHPKTTENIFFLLSYPIHPNKKEDILSLIFTIQIRKENLKEIFLKLIEICHEEIMEEMLTRSYHYYEQFNEVENNISVDGTLKQIKEYLLHLQNENGMVYYHRKKISTLLHILHSLTFVPEPIVLKELPQYLFHVEHKPVLIRDILN